MRAWPLVERKVLLAELLPRTGTVHAISWVEKQGEALFATAVDRDLEGVVAKRLDAPYKAGRQNVWLKIKNQAYARPEALVAARSAAKSTTVTSANPDHPLRFRR